MSKSQENDNKILRLKSPAGAESAIYRWPLPRYVSYSGNILKLCSDGNNIALTSKTIIFILMFQSNLVHTQQKLQSFRK